MVIYELELLGGRIHILGSFTEYIRLGKITFRTKSNYNEEQHMPNNLLMN